MLEHLNFEIKHSSSALSHLKINFIRELVNTSEESYVVVKFSVRVSGEYRIHVMSGLENLRGSPFSKTLLPGYLDIEKTEFLRPSPTVLCTTFEDKLLHIRPKDKFENICKVTSKDLESFNFTANWVSS